MKRVLLCVLLAACGGDDHPANGDGGGGGDDAAQPDGPPISPPTTCTVPAEGMQIDTSASTNVVGHGSVETCTAAALEAAVQQGGLIRFDCGPANVAIQLTHALVINNTAGSDMLGDVVIDGGGLITLDGNAVTRHIYLNACAPPYNSPHCDTFPHPHLTVENMRFINGSDNSNDGGGSIYREGGALTVIDSTFENNHGAYSGQDTAGGAIRLVQATPALIVGSTFADNTCSDGGAIGSLQATPVTIINSVITHNQTTGTGGNPGDGGNGGGIYHDGTGLELTLCGVQLTNNTANAFGAGLFYVDDAGQGTVSIANTEIDTNTIAQVSGMPSHGGGGYIQGADITLANVTIANNSAGYAAGLYTNLMNGNGSLNGTNVTSANNAGDGLTNSGCAGTLLNATFAGNTRGITGAGTLTLTNSIVADGCDVAAAGGANSFSADGSCGAGFSTADAMLGTLGVTGTGYLQTIAPAAASPAKAAGQGCPATDELGTARPANGCTSGAYQL
ncbi:MAG TPA: choice-of-anchor Q domain-containing protein [Kofleriaceae bacterium]|jgi:hypothetical protein